MTRPPVEYARWPTLLAGVTLAGGGVGLDIVEGAPMAYALLGLSSACFGAFLYAEGARHREWWTNAREERRSVDVPSRDDHDV